MLVVLYSFIDIQVRVVVCSVLLQALLLRMWMERSEGWPLCTASAAAHQSRHFVIGSVPLYIDAYLH